MLLLCYCLVMAMLLPCYCHAFAMLLLCYCHAIALLLLCPCHADPLAKDQNWTLDLDANETSGVSTLSEQFEFQPLSRTMFRILC